MKAASLAQFGLKPLPIRDLAFCVGLHAREQLAGDPGRLKAALSRSFKAEDDAGQCWLFPALRKSVSLAVNGYDFVERLANGPELRSQSLHVNLLSLG